MRFVTMFPEAQNVHLIKDVGMIPYVMHEEYGFDSAIACYDNDKYTYLLKEVKGLKIDFIEKYTGNSMVDGIIYLMKNSKKIDVLHLFHFCKRTSVWICMYKLFNTHGKVFLKLDASNKIMSSINPNKKILKAYAKRLIISRCDLISVETHKIYNFMKNNWKINIQYIPNGFYDYKLKRIVNYREKENIILTVGRIGSYEKATDILLQGFKLASKHINNWRLRIIGPIQNGFKEYLNEFFDENPQLKSRIDIVGAVYDRSKLEQEYRHAKIFCLTSRYESFGLVFVEAIKNGCYVITSKVDASIDITNDGQYGNIFEIDNVNDLAESLIKNCNNENNLLDNCVKIQNFAYKNFDWKVICKKIINSLNV